MRLIDADNLIKCFEEDLEDKYIGHYITAFINADAKLYEIKAIPIEWLEKRAQECLIDRQITGSEIGFVKKLVDEWEKENDLGITY